jgi:hypothetical protein
MAYEYRRYCQCKACVSAIGLSLKVITHYGEFTRYNVRNFSKLLGRDVIIAHQLLKNDIDRHEYWLVTNSILNGEPPAFEKWMQWDASSKETDAGIIPYRYLQLEPLKNRVEPEPLPQIQLKEKNKVISVTEEYPSDIIPLFHLTGDFTYRHKWMEGVKAVEELDHYLPRIGMRCRCLLYSGENSIFSSSYSFSPEHIEFSETSEKDHATNYFILHKTGECTTRLTIEHYIPNRFLSAPIFRFGRKKAMERDLRKSLENLKAVLKEPVGEPC